MTTLRGVLQNYVSSGSVPGAVGLVARGDQIDVHGHSDDREGFGTGSGTDSYVIMVDARGVGLRGLAGGPAAVGEDGLAGDQRGGRGGQEHHHAGYFDGLADAVQGGDALDDVRAELRVR